MSDSKSPRDSATNKQYSRRKLDSNWERYNELPSDEDDADTLAADFEQILLAATSVGEHFTFADERKWLKELGDDTSIRGSTLRNIFQLNVQALKESVAKLPFHLRTNMSKEEFSHSEISDMDYQYTCLSAKLHSFGEITTSPATPASLPKRDVYLATGNFVEQRATGVQQPTIPSCGTEKPNTAGAAVETQPTTAAKKSANTAKHSLDDIQDWLDDILNTE